MKTLFVLLVLAGAAVADPKSDAEAVVKTHLANVLNASVIDTMTPDASIYAGTGSREPNNANDIKYSLMDDIKDKDAPTTTIGKLAVTVDANAKIGWFTAPLTVKYTTAKNKKGTKAVRASGFLVDDGGWKIAAVLYARPVTDAQLKSELADKVTIDPSRFKGDATVLQAGKDMFGGFLKTASANPGIHAVGTGPQEVGTDAKAARVFAKNWDGIKLEVFDMHARKSGRLGLVQGMAQWSVKQKVALMGFLGALVEEGGSWRWVGLYWDGS